MGNHYVFITLIPKPQAEVSEERPERFPQPRGAQGPFPPHHHVSTNSPRGLLAKTAATTSRIEKEQVGNAFCLRVGSKTTEKI